MQQTWDEICEDKALCDLPYKIETNRYGQIVMSSLGRFQDSVRRGGIAGLLHEHAEGGEVSTETAIQTSDGVKAADVAGVSKAFFEAHRHDSVLTTAPEICVEVLSDSNSVPAIQEKVVLYFAQGAEEVWLCDEDGKMIFYLSPTLTAPQSAMFPAFPPQV